jgi:hypothetical protein
MRLHAVHLSRVEERAEAIDGLADRIGRRVGLDDVLTSLNRQARRVDVPGAVVDWGFGWNDQDAADPLWWPQGITTSADAAFADDDRVQGRRLLVVSWYHKGPADSQGSRITFIDAETLEYRHVLLVSPVETPDGLRFRSLEAHAGGLVWYGPFLHVAGTRRGIYTCWLDDIVEVEPSADTMGCRYLLPVRFSYEAGSADDTEPLRYSFLSVDRAADPVEMVGGEFGFGGQTTRLVRYAIDPATRHLSTEEDGFSRPLTLEDGVGHMQGAAIAGGNYFISLSRGPDRNGDLIVGRPGDFHLHKRALPAGPEDITYWPATDRLWCLTEHPNQRYVFAINRESVLP